MRGEGGLPARVFTVRVRVETVVAKLLIVEVRASTSVFVVFVRSGMKGVRSRRVGGTCKGSVLHRVQVVGLSDQ